MIYISYEQVYLYNIYTNIIYIGLQRRFKIIDDDGSKSLNMAEFKKALKEFKMDLSEADLRMLFEYFDTDQSGKKEGSYRIYYLLLSH